MPFFVSGSKDAKNGEKNTNTFKGDEKTLYSENK